MSGIGEIEKADVKLTLNMEPWEFAEVRDEFLADLAAVLDISTVDIEIVSITKGCTQLALRIPLDKKEIYDLIASNKGEFPEPQLIEIANFVRKYKVVIFGKLRPAIHSNGNSRKDMAGQSLTWLHLSDMHFKDISPPDPRRSWAQDKVKETFIRDLPELLRAEMLKPDFVFFTGDIAHSGSKREYDLAFDFLGKLRGSLPREEQAPVVLVPGNHDVDRQSAEHHAEEEVEAVGRLKDNYAIMDFMRLPRFDDKKGKIFERLANYNEFADRCRCYGQPARNHSEVVSTIFDHGGLRVGVAAMNSAWRCSSNEDRGRLVLGAPQLDDAMRSLESADLRIALIHHPPESDWFVADDTSYQREYLPFFDFVLRGHEHDPHVQLSFFAGREYCHVSAGALYSTDAYQKSFNVIQLDFEYAKAWVFFWKLSPKTLKWVKDVDIYANGYHVFDIPPKLADRLGIAAESRFARYKA